MRLGTSPLLFAVLLISCSRGNEPIEPRLGAAPSEMSADDQSLTDLLTCQDPEFFEGSPEWQAEQLAIWPEMSCRVEQQGGPYAECEASHPLQLFGLPLRGVMVCAAEDEFCIAADLEAEPATVAEAAGRALGVDLGVRNQPGSSISYVFETDALSYRVVALRPGWASFGCSLGNPVGSSTLPREEVPVGAAVISGRLSYPSEYIPAMRVCAIDPDDPGRGYCTQTAIDDSAFRLIVPPGQWWLLAWPRGTGADVTPARYSEATECLARGGSDCADHRLRPVSLVAGEHRSDVDLLDWPDAETYPPPMEPRGEAPPGRASG